MLETKFDNFLIAHITDDYLKEKNKLLHHHRLCLLVEIRYMAIPQDEGKDVGLDSKYFRNHKKYMRDITTERGRINIMAREIPCVCMKEKKIEANKSMAKFAQCFCCEEEFSKKQMLRCKGCDLAQYCSKACQKKKWPEHKAFCKNITVSSAAASASASIPSSFVEPSDVDADYYQQQQQEEEEMDDVDKDDNNNNNNNNNKNNAVDQNNDHFIYNNNTITTTSTNTNLQTLTSRFNEYEYTNKNKNKNK